MRIFDLVDVLEEDALTEFGHVMMIGYGSRQKEERSMDNTKLARINELARKSKAEGLTSAERQEQALLRSEYLEAVRRNLKGQLDNIDIVNKDGSVENLGKKYEERYGKKGN